MDITKLAISQNQKKIIIMGGVIFLVFLLFWGFFYLPASREIKSLKSQLWGKQQQIQGIEALVAGSLNRNEAILLLKEKQKLLNNKFPQKEEESLRVISEAARKHNVEILSLEPGAKTEFLDATNAKVVVDSQVLTYLPVSIEVSCFYKNLVGYLLELRNSLPAFVSMTSINIKKEDLSSGKVRVSIGFNLYLLV